MVIAVSSAGAALAETTRPRLVVLVYFDQLRGDYLSRWTAEFGEGGFKRLMNEGAWYRNCHYPYAYTVTAAGHASVATGCPPADHGVVGNDWYDRTVGKSVNCVGSDLHRQIPARAIEGKEDDEKRGTRGGVSPERLLKPTIADAIKQSTDGRGKVVALSLKNRGAALPGGKTPDACYWMDGVTGQFVTSTYYRNGVHPWVLEFNQAKPALRWKGKVWDRFRSDIDYVSLSGPDDAAGESQGASGQGRVFPHPLEPTDPKVKPAYLSALYASPFGNELLMDFAATAIAAEALGKDDTPDLLSLSFSSNDAVGHAWGPDSQEVFDITLRSDQIMKRLLETLDSTVGKGRYVLAMTADHGVCALPEMSRKQGRGAMRVQAATAAQIETFLGEKFGETKTKWIEASPWPWIYLNGRAVKEAGVPQAEVEAALAAWLIGQPGVQAAYTRTRLTEAVAALDPTGKKVVPSFHPERSGDIYVLLQPYCLSSSVNGTGTTHGTPWEYDTHVPLVIYGTGIRRGIRDVRVSPLSTAEILAKSIGINSPKGATTRAPDDLFHVVKE